jgi:protein AaeX
MKRLKKMFEEINIFGVYVAPIVVMMIGAWVIMLPINRISNFYSLTTRVWHSSLFNLCIYIVVLATIVAIYGAQ